MDRRGFCKILLLLPLFSPSFDISKKTRGDFELQLITSFPHKFITPLLQEIQKHGFLQGQNFTTINFHPQQADLTKALSGNQWKRVQSPSQADLVFAFSRLIKPVPGSFALIRNEKVWDIRFNRLLSIWKEMCQAPSSWLTSISSPKRTRTLYRGNKASVYLNGQKVDTISLKKNYSKSFTTKGGQVDVLVEEGKARVADSPCPQKICLHTPPITFEGERIICVPNHFLLEIESHYSVDTAIG
jgi:hypothetical protein